MLSSSEFRGQREYLCASRCFWETLRLSFSNYCSRSQCHKYTGLVKFNFAFRTNLKYKLCFRKFRGLRKYFQHKTVNHYRRAFKFMTSKPPEYLLFIFSHWKAVMKMQNIHIQRPRRGALSENKDVFRSVFRHLFILYFTHMKYWNQWKYDIVNNLLFLLRKL